MIVFGLAACSGNTTPATNITATSATLNASAKCGDNGNHQGNCYYEFRWGTDPNNLSQHGALNGPYSTTNGSSVPLSLPITDLQPATTYYFALCGKGDGFANSNDPEGLICVGPNGQGTTSSFTTSTPQPQGPGGTWRLAFDDEMNGTAVDTSKWDLMDGGRSNNVTTKASNVAEGGGHATLTLSDATTGAEICSAPSTASSGDCFGTTPNGWGLPVGGFMEARVEFPGNGSSLADWAAFWASGPSWPAAGEIDVAESEGGALTANYHNPAGGKGSGPIAGSWAGQWHTYGVYRAADHDDVYWDGALVWSVSTSDNGQPEDLLAIIGNGNGNPLVVGDQLLVDYVRGWTAG